MRLRDLFGLWLPLAVSFELMMLEGPAIQGAIGRLPDPPLNLAAFGLTMSLSLLIESPVIMLIATAIALVRDGPSYRALRRFMITLALGCTALTGLIAFTPLFDLIALRVMEQPPAIARAARAPLQIMLLWTAAIAWRRFYQGVLVRSGRTRRVSYGTAIRLVAAVVTAVVLARWGGIPGAQVGAWALLAAVVTEAIATSFFAFPVIRREILPLRGAEGEGRLTQREIWRFHTPLAATTLLTLLAQPMTSAALARLPEPEATLAAWPVVFMLLLVMRGWGLSLQEITVAQARTPQAQPVLRRFTWWVGGVTSGATALIAATPLLDLYLDRVIHLPPHLSAYTHVGVAVGVLMPFLTALGSWARGVLVAAGRTGVIYQGMAVNLTLHFGLLVLGVLLVLPGMWVAAGAFTLAAIAEYLFLARRAVALAASVSVPTAA